MQKKKPTAMKNKKLTYRQIVMKKLKKALGGGSKPTKQQTNRKHLVKASGGMKPSGHSKHNHSTYWGSNKKFKKRLDEAGKY